MNVTVIGCGRWGSLITWYLDRQGHTMTLYGRENSANMNRFLETRSNDLLTLPESVNLSTSIDVTKNADAIIISINAQGLRAFMHELQSLGLRNKIFVLCMKGIEAETGKRLSEIVTELTDPSNRVAVWLGPGHVQEFYAGIPNCMVIDSADSAATHLLVNAFSGDLIRFYYGDDLIGNEIGGAAKNVIGIAAGFLDGLGLSSLKGALMSRGTRELSRLLEAMGVNPVSAYGLCHLGDYEATVFSKYSHNRRFGEDFVQGRAFEKLAEGCETARGMHLLANRYAVELPICEAVYSVLHKGEKARDALDVLFMRSLKKEF